MRVCLVYDCLYPHTVGGAERWYRDLALRLAGEGHDVTYLTLRQWPRGERADIDGDVRVVTAGPRMGLYTESGRRRMLPPLVFGLGVLVHLLRNRRRYDVVHTDSFPYFSLLAAGLVRPLGSFELVVDWFEVWSRSYWHDYLGGVGGRIGAFVQRLCARVPQRAVCFSQMHATRLHEEGLRGPVTVLRGLYAGNGEPFTPGPVQPRVMFAARLIPEKQVALAVAAVALAAARIEGLSGVFFGDGPELSRLREAIAEHGLTGVVSAPGFAETETVEAEMRAAMCMLVTSRREGYGLVVVEAAARGTPSVVVAGEDNAATELIEEGANGTVAERSDAEAIAAAIVRVYEAGPDLRERTAAWFAENEGRLSLESSLRTVLGLYAGSAPDASAAVAKPGPSARA